MPSEPEKRSSDGIFCPRFTHSRSKSRRIGIIIGRVQARKFGADARTPV
ncbi:TPA: hypothetical protein ACJJ8K_001286 [Neisseria meningitidis]